MKIYFPQTLRSFRSRLYLHFALLPLVAAILAPWPAHATNGYFSHGYGIKALGMAGVGSALPQDGFAAAYNPAGTALVDDQLDLGATWFMPRRSATITGNAFGPDESFDGDGRKNFIIPELAYVHRLSPRLSAGVAVYGHGGMNTDYQENPYARFGATGSAGVNLEQLFITPSLAWKVNDNHAIGIALNAAYQRFDARGLEIFGAFSQAPGNVSNQGTDTSTGVGVRLGWTGTVLPGITVGASWASKINGRFDKYRGLFADNGGFDIPENYGIGIAWQPSQRWTLAADLQEIRYGDVGSVGNPVARLYAGVPLGANDGPGFGWRNSTTYKFGISHQVGERLTLRAGYSHLRQPIPAQETFFNILAPGVVEDHATVGATWRFDDNSELSGFFAHAFGNTVNGSESIPPGFPPAGLGGGNANIRLRENMLGLSYSWRL
ncbi:MAG: outer membrane protein transport protein [Gammaproteobacteria bacterium]